MYMVLLLFVGWKALGRVYDFFVCTPGGAACKWYCYRFLLQEPSMALSIFTNSPVVTRVFVWYRCYTYLFFWGGGGEPFPLGSW